MFYSQPLADRFGTALINSLQEERWSKMEIAVAWARRSGVQHIHDPLNAFLRRGGSAQVTVGIDVENTSIEGLMGLLELEQNGQMETFVHHNEASPIFHPKVYLFRNDSAARLIVGSNNLTQGGLFTNVEAGLQIETGVDDSAIIEARTALAAWRDISSGFACRLTEILLRDLSALGYVLSEEVLRTRRSTNEAKSAGRRKPDQRLFKAQNVTAPLLKRPKVMQAANVAGTVLLMRVRRASERDRRTQIQIPITLVRTAFFAGVTSIRSSHDDRVHQLSEASARGTVNTIKLEIPEIDPMTDPVLRLERTEAGIFYQAFDANSVLGRPIINSLDNGLKLVPPQTMMTRAPRATATLWRFI